MISSQKRLRCIMTVDIAERIRSHNLCQIRSPYCFWSGHQIQAALLYNLVKRISSSRKRTCTQADSNSYALQYHATASVSFEHFKISAHMMCQCNGLCFLQMGESRHNGLGIFFHDVEADTFRRPFTSSSVSFTSSRV